jgi:hypothetical protein
MFGPKDSKKKAAQQKERIVIIDCTFAARAIPLLKTVQVK